MLQGQRPGLRTVDMMLLHTGWAQWFGIDTYLDNPALTVAAAQWLVAQGIKLLGVDFATLDLALPTRLPGFDWQVQQVLVSNGVLIAENLADFGPLVRERIELVWRARLRPQAPGRSHSDLSGQAETACTYRQGTTQGKPAPATGARRRNLSATSRVQAPNPTTTNRRPPCFLSFISGEFTESRPTRCLSRWARPSSSTTTD